MNTLNHMPNYNNHRLLSMKDAEKVNRIKIIPLNISLIVLVLQFYDFYT